MATNSIQLSEEAQKVVNVLNKYFTLNQSIVIAETLYYAGWGDAEEKFNSEDWEGCWGGCTNDLWASAPTVRRIYGSRSSLSGVFSGISNILKGEAGRYFQMRPDWWGDGTGDMLFINLDEFGGTNLDKVLKEVCLYLQAQPEE